MDDRLDDLYKLSGSHSSPSSVSSDCSTALIYARSSPQFQHTLDEDDGVVLCTMMDKCHVDKENTFKANFESNKVTMHHRTGTKRSEKVNEVGVSKLKEPKCNNNEFIDTKLLEQTTQNSCGGQSNFGSFLRRVGVIQIALRAATENIDRIKHLKYAGLHTASPEKENELSNIIGEIFKDNNILIAKTRSAIDAIQSENDRYSATMKDSATWRSQKNIHLALLRKFRTCVQEYRLVKAEYKQEVSRKVTRQVKLVYPEISDEDIASIVESGGLHAACAINSYVGKGVDDFHTALSDIRSRWSDIKKLEAGIAELNQMFTELAVLVSQQEEPLDDIERSVSRTKELSDVTVTDLKIARRFQVASLMRRVSLGVVIIILIWFTLFHYVKLLF